MNENNLEKYFETLDQRAKLEGLIAQSSEDLRPTIEDAIASANNTLAEYESDSVLGLEIARFGETVESDLGVIEELQSSVEMGLLPAEVVEEKKESILRDSRKATALKYFQELKLLQSTGITEAIEPEVTSEAVQQQTEEQIEALEKEKEYPKIDITIRGDAVQIGKKGRFVQLSKTYGSEHKRNFSEERKAVLKALVSNAGEQMRVKDLWEAAFGNQEVDGYTMNQVRAWLDKNITYYRAPIVSHNGKRGSASAYIIANPNVSIKEIAVTTPKIQVKKTPVQPDLASEIELDTSMTPTENETVTQAEEKEILPSVEFPLNHAESIIIAEFLNVRSKALEACGIPTFEDEAVKSLYVKDKTFRVGQELKVKYNNDLITAREEIIKRVNEYFEDGEVVLADIENMSAKDFRIELFQYLFDLDSEQREMLLSVIAAATPDTVITLDGGSFNRGVQIVKAEAGFVSADGVRLEIKTDTTQSQVQQEDESEQQQLIDDARALIDEAADQDLPSEEEPVLEDASDSHKSDELQSTEAATEEWEEKFIDDVTKAIETLIEDGLLLADTEIIALDLLNKKSKSRIHGTKTGLKRAVSLGIISYGQSELSVRETVSMVIQNSNKSIFSAPKKSRKRIKADQIIDERISAIQEKLRQEV